MFVFDSRLCLLGRRPCQYDRCSVYLDAPTKLLIQSCACAEVRESIIWKGSSPCGKALLNILPTGRGMDTFLKDGIKVYIIMVY